MIVKINRQYFCGAFMNVFQTNNNASENSNISIIIFDFEILMKNDYISNTCTPTQLK